MMPLGTELRRALRWRLRRPWAGFLIVLTLALGIGAAAAMIGLADLALWRPLPFPAAERLVLIAESVQGLPADWLTASYPDYLDWQRGLREFAALGIQRPWAPVARAAGEPFRVEGAEVSPQLLDLLGIRPALGRGFQGQDFRPGAEPVVLVSDRLWQDRFGRDPRLLGSAVSFGERAFTVVGILPPGAPLLQPAFFRPPDALAPLVAEEQMAGRGGRIYRVLARLQEGASLEQAGRKLDALSRTLAAAHPETNAGWSARALPLREAMVGKARPSLQLLAGAGLLVLLLACTNVVNILLAEAGPRRRELAVQAALGASRRSLVQTVVAESLPLALLGLLLGLLVSLWCWRLAAVALPASFSGAPGAAHLVIDGRFLGLALGLTAGAFLLMVCAPLAPGRWPAPRELTICAARAAASCGPPPSARELLLVAQIALATLLLITTSMMTRSLLRLLEVDLGFRPAGTWAFELELPFSRYSEPRPAWALARELLASLRGQSGIRDAAIATRLPFQEGGMSTGVGVEKARLLDWQIELKGVSPRYFSTLGIPLQGRDFTAQDFEGDRKVVVLSDAAARRLWPGQSALGRRVFVDWDAPSLREVIGVAGDARQELSRPARPEVYLPFPQLPFWSIDLVAHAPRKPAEAVLAGRVREAVRRLDPGLPVIAATPVSEMVEATLGRPRLHTRVVAAFSAFSVLLGMAGVWSLTAALVTRQRYAIAVRIALGARPRDVLRLILGRMARLVAAGLFLGLLAAALAARALSSVLYEVRPVDAVSFFSMPLLLAGLALAAAFVPAWRASRLPPLSLLKEL